LKGNDSNTSSACCWFGRHWSCGARFAVINSREGIIKRDVRDGDEEKSEMAEDGGDGWREEWKCT
jgi:hypothetical protein